MIKNIQDYRMPFRSQGNSITQYSLFTTDQYTGPVTSQRTQLNSKEF